MTEAIMRASLCRIGALLAATLALASSSQRVSAQAIQNGLEVKRVVNGTQSTIKADSIVYANADDCDGSTTFLFTPTLYAIAAPVVEAWLAVGDSKDCRVPTNRTKQSTSSSETICKFLGRNTDSSLKPTLEIDGRRLFDGDGVVDEDGNYGCDQVRGSPKYYVYIIPLDTATTDVTAAQAKTLGSVSTLIATFTPYTKAPDAPTNLRSIDGENSLGVKYTEPSTANTYTRYRAYFDVSPSPDAGSELEAGTEGDAAMDVDAAMEDDGGTEMDAAAMDAGASVDAQAGDADTEAGQKDAGSDEGTSAPCASGLLKGGEAPPAEGTPNVRRSGKVSGDTAALKDVDDIIKGSVVAVAVTTFDAAGNESVLSTPVCVRRVETTSYLDACRVEGNDCGLESCGLQIGRRSSALALIGLVLAAAALLRRRRSA